MFINSTHVAATSSHMVALTDMTIIVKACEVYTNYLETMNVYAANTKILKLGAMIICSVIFSK
jgi:hypothetical protein